MEARSKAYLAYGPYLREKYKGQRVFKIIVDGGFTCPNRDGSKGFGGCTYCNVDSFTPEAARKLPSIREQVEESMRRAREQYKAEKFIVYFQPNTNTYAPTHYLYNMYREALSIHTEDIVGLSIGTRPDCLDEEKVKMIEGFSSDFDVDLEMGMESIHDETLKLINRGCSHAEFEAAMELTRNRNFDVCVHTVFGFPNESKEQMLQYADVLNQFTHIKFVKLHHLHIVEGSIMGVHYRRNPFPLFSMEEYTQFLSEFIPLLRPDLIIQRLFGLADKQYLIAPNWGLKKSEIQAYIDKGLLERNVFQGSKLVLK